MFFGLMAEYRMWVMSPKTNEGAMRGLMLVLLLIGTIFAKQDCDSYSINAVEEDCVKSDVVYNTTNNDYSTTNITYNTTINNICFLCIEFVVGEHTMNTAPYVGLSGTYLTTPFGSVNTGKATIGYMVRGELDPLYGSFNMYISRYLTNVFIQTYMIGFGMCGEQLCVNFDMGLMNRETISSTFGTGSLGASYRITKHIDLTTSINVSGWMLDPDGLGYEDEYMYPDFNGGVAYVW